MESQDLQIIVNFALKWIPVLPLIVTALHQLLIVPLTNYILKGAGKNNSSNAKLRNALETR